MRIWWKENACFLRVKSGCFAGKKQALCAQKAGVL
jgi:hypothetical protein